MNMAPAPKPLHCNDDDSPVPNSYTEILCHEYQDYGPYDNNPMREKWACVWKEMNNSMLKLCSELTDIAFASESRYILHHLRTLKICFRPSVFPANIPDPLRRQLRKFIRAYNKTLCRILFIFNLSFRELHEAGVLSYVEFLREQFIIPFERDVIETFKTMPDVM